MKKIYFASKSTVILSGTMILVFLAITLLSFPAPSLAIDPPKAPTGLRIKNITPGSGVLLEETATIEIKDSQGNVVDTLELTYSEYVPEEKGAKIEIMFLGKDKSPEHPVRSGSKLIIPSGQSGYCIEIYSVSETEIRYGICRKRQED